VKLVLLYLFLSISPVFSATISLENKEISEGQIFSGIINFSQAEAIDIKDPKIIEKKYIFNKIYISEITKIKRENGLLVAFLGVAISPLGNKESGYLELNSKKFLIELNEPKFKTNGLTPKKDLYLYELSSGIVHNMEKWILLFILLVLLGTGYFAYKFIVKKKLRNQLNNLRVNEKKFWKKQFSIAVERKDFEHIYMKRKLWEKILDMQDQKRYLFFEKLNDIQYKKDWSAFEKDEIIREFQKLKNKIIENNGI